MIPTERIIEDAELAAVYLRALLDRGLPAMAAVTLTGNYINARVFTESQKAKPREPWEGEDPA